MIKMQVQPQLPPNIGWVHAKLDKNHIDFLWKRIEESKKNNALPTSEEAFIEALKSYSPRREFPWSHPIVYFAGRKTGWSSLNEKGRKEIFYDFKRNYESLIGLLNKGKKFSIPKNKTTEELKPLNQKLFASLRKKHNI